MVTACPLHGLVEDTGVVRRVPLRTLCPMCGHKLLSYVNLVDYALSIEPETDADAGDTLPAFGIGVSIRRPVAELPA